jgi:hypothetical protein
VRARLDWKYALGLELTDPGFDFSVLSEFRSRLINSRREGQLLEQMLKCFRQKGLIKARGKARTDSTHVLAAIGQLNRIECVAETLRHALNELASVAPEWLIKQVSGDIKLWQIKTFYQRNTSWTRPMLMPSICSAAVLSMTLTWLDLCLVTVAGKPKLLKVLTYLVFTLTGKLNKLPVLWDVKATPGICTVTIMTILWSGYDFDPVIVALVPIVPCVLAHPSCLVF